MRSISEYKDGVEESVTSVNCVVCVSEVKNEPEQVSHDNDALFRTPTVGCIHASSILPQSPIPEKIPVQQ